MRKRLRLVAVTVLAAAAIMSCATLAPRPGTLTVELYDWRSVADPAGGGAMDFVLPVPAIQGSAPGSDLAVSDLTVTPQPVPAGPQAAEKPALPAGSAGAAEVPAVVGLTALRSPRPASGFPLAQPAPPALSPAPRPATASRSATTASPAPKSSAAPSQAVAATPRAPTATAGSAGASTGSTTVTSAAGTPAAGTPAGSTSTPAAADSYGRLREIYARVGDEMQIGLDGTGFLFLGFPDTRALADGMSFKTKEIRGGKTWFTFKALKLGTYDLDFLQQDNVSGTSAKETVRVHVVSDQDFSAAVSQPEVDGNAAEAGDPAFADKLTGLGAYEAAVAELLKGYRDGNTALNDRIAGLYMRMGSYDAAGKYYQKNLSVAGPLADAAVMGLVRVAAALKDQTGLMARLKGFLAIRDPAAEEPLILAVRMERDQGQVGVGLDLAAEYATRYPQGRWRDEAEFIAAQFLEADSQFRDIARARDLYRDVVSSYPVGEFAAAAQDRLQYIERHFYQIR